jgi:hypothetical protein
MFTTSKSSYLKSYYTSRLKVGRFQIFLGLLLILVFSSCSQIKDPPNKTITLHQLQEMSDMATVEIFVSRIVKAVDDPPWYKYGDRRILMSVGARLKAGINMNEIKDENIQITGSSVRLELPAARLISLTIDPESIKEEYIRTGFFRSSFTNEERYDFLKQAEFQIRESIDGMGLLEAAELNSIAFFESWLKLMGFDDVQVVIKRN